jgi:hypothetical protein
MSDYTKFQMYSYGTHNLVETWQTYGHNAAILADVEYRDGMCTVTVYDPTTSRCRTYDNRPTVAALGIVERHLERMGYKNCVEVRDLTAETSED